jgi:hypothetical protein
VIQERTLVKTAAGEEAANGEVAHTPGRTGGASRFALAARRHSRRLLSRWLSRRSLLWPLLLYLIAAQVQMWPLSRRDIIQHGEIGTMTAGVVEAGRALREGQFPIRVLPFQNFGTRYPLFQFYCNGPFTVAGLLDLLPGINPYEALKRTILVALVLGALFTYRCALRMTRHRGASIWAGLLFLMAPYLFTDLHARGAIAETIALCLLPVALYYTTRCFASPRRRYVLLTALAWTAIAHTHNIIYLYGVLFIGLYVAARLRPGRRYLARVGRLALAGVLHGLLVLWYFVPQFYLVKDLTITGNLPSPIHMAWLTVPEILFSPVLATPVGSTTDRLGLQVGWPLLAAAIGALATIVIGLLPRRLWARGDLLLRRRRGPRRPSLWTIAGLLVLFTVALYLAWSPLEWDPWPYLPKTLYYVQFPFRLLAFVVFWGSLLAACVLARAAKGGRIPVLGHAVLALAVAQSASTYLHRIPVHNRSAIRSLIRAPWMGGRFDYMLSTEATSRTSRTFAGMDLAAWEFGLVGEYGGRYFWPQVAPVPQGARTILVEGTCTAPAPPARGQPPLRIGVRVGSTVVNQDLAPGTFALRVPLPPDPHPATGGVLVDIATDPPMGAPVTVNHIRWEGDLPPDPEPVITADQMKPPKVLYGRDTRSNVNLDRRALVEFPVLYYPHVLRVTDNGSRIPYGNIGRFVALDLPAGRHQIKIRFAGITWANAASASGVGLLVVMVLPKRWLKIRRRRRAAA